MCYLPSNEYSPSGEYFVGVLRLREYSRSLTHVRVALRMRYLPSNGYSLSSLLRHSCKCR